MKFNKNIDIQGTTISNNSRTFIIAEAGVNHNGNMDTAKKMIDAAIDAKADAVKFQAFKTENLILDNVEKANYQKKSTGSNESQFQMLKKLEISKQNNKELLDYCNDRGIIFLSTPFDEESAEELYELDVPAFKIASTDLTNLLFLKKISKFGKPIILSTGMSFFKEVKLALEQISKFNKDVILLQCTANYPIKDYEVNLNVIKTYQDTFDVIVGYSDHSKGLGASMYAIPMGAKLVEKHFTLDVNQTGPDHKASLTPKELKDYVSEIRKIETYMGSSLKEPSKSELKTRCSLQKCLVAKHNIKKGDIFTEKNIVAKRTGGIGLSPLNYKDLLNKMSSRDYQENDIIHE